MRYLENRGLIPPTPRKVWAFVGDGETDEPESLGSLTLGSREKLDNLIFVVNCNLQRLDGPVRGNGKIINELEAAFRGAGWNVIKVIWGSDWDKLFARDKTGLLLKRMEECVDGELPELQGQGRRVHPHGVLRQVSRAAGAGRGHERRRTASPDAAAATIRRRFTTPTSARSSITAVPTVILAQTVKGYGLGSAEARNATHSGEEAGRPGADRIPHALRDSDSRRGGARRLAVSSGGRQPGDHLHAGAAQGTGRLHADARAHAHRRSRRRRWSSSPSRWRARKGRAVSTTMGFVSMLRQLLKDPKIGKLDRAHHPRRGPHLRHGVDHPAGRHLRQPGTALQAARSGHAALLPRGEERPDPGGRHHRSRLDGIVHRGGNGVLRTTTCR